MGFLSLIIALLLEQVRPLQNDNAAYNSVRSITALLERNFNAGEKQQAMLAWMLLVLPLTIGAWLIFYLLVRAHPFLGLGWNILILYLTLGFRQFSHYYTDIQLALANNDLPLARALLTQWVSAKNPRFSAAELSVAEVARIAIEEALVASHRHVFGVLFWFVLLPGPSGALLYRLANFLARGWNKPSRQGLRMSEEPPDAFGQFASSLFRYIDWLPVRFSAVGFAIVGNFEDAIFCWRNHASQWKDEARGIILAAGAGALGLRLGERQILHSLTPVATLTGQTVNGGINDELGANFSEGVPGVECSPAAMRSAVGLVWRAMVLWLLLLLLLSVAGLLG